MSPPTQTQTTQTPHEPIRIPPDLRQEYIARTAWKQGVIGTLNLATAILAIRLILLLAVLGAIGLTWLALAQPEPLRLGAVGLYSASVVLPLVWLAGR